jgi:hypothetical protein
MLGTEAFLSMVANADREQYPTKVEALVAYFREGWEVEERPPALDSQEASELATRLDRNRRVAVREFRGMDPEMRQRLEAAAAQVLGPSEARSLLRTLQGK